MSENYLHLPHRVCNTDTLCLNWQPARREGSATTLLINHETQQLPPLKSFLTALRVAKMFDYQSLAIPGCVVALPLGARLLRGYRNLVRRHLDGLGIEEFEYPHVLQGEVLRQTEAILSLQNAAFYLEHDRSSEQRRLALCPTGEATIYHHWRSLLKTSHQLPIKMFRQATYFRPLTSGHHSGGSVYKSLEASDVFEIHSAFESDDQAKAYLSVLYSSLQNFLQKFDVPTVWGARPLAFNRSQVSQMTIGADTLLPSGGTVQTSCLYDQGQIFSRAFGIQYKAGKEAHYTHHITAAVTRRLFYTMLHYGVKSDQTIFVHPSIAATRCLMVFKDHESPSSDAPTDFEVMMWDKNISYKQILNKARDLGTPLLAIVRSTSPQLTLVRLDTMEEWSTDLSTAAEITRHVTLAIRDLCTAWSHSLKRFAARQFVNAETLAEVVAALKKRQTVVAYLAQEKLPEFAQLQVGEILSMGRSASGEQGRCILTGKIVDNVAVMSTRI